MWTILIFIVIGMVAGWAASLLIRREKYPTDWGVLFIIGISGSLVAGIVINLHHGRGLQDRPRRHHRLHRRGLPAALAVRARPEPRPRSSAAPRPAPNGQHRERKGGKKHHSKR